MEANTEAAVNADVIKARLEETGLKEGEQPPRAAINATIVLEGGMKIAVEKSTAKANHPAIRPSSAHKTSSGVKPKPHLV
jgi:hypothetical protein